MANRRFQCLLIGATILMSWWAMQAVHEAGHVLHAWWSGATVQRVLLVPTEISRTDFDPNPHPLFVAWGGPIWGCLIPLLVWGMAALLQWSRTFLTRFFVGFCLVANGAYLSVGSFEGIGDAGDLLRHGASQWMLIAFGLVTIPCGFWAWHGLGPSFGWTKSPQDKREEPRTK